MRDIVLNCQYLILYRFLERSSTTVRQCNVSCSQSMMDIYVLAPERGYLSTGTTGPSIKPSDTFSSQSKDILDYRTLAELERSKLLDTSLRAFLYRSSEKHHLTKAGSRLVNLQHEPPLEDSVEDFLSKKLIEIDEKTLRLALDENFCQQSLNRISASGSPKAHSGSQTTFSTPLLEATFSSQLDKNHAFMSPDVAAALNEEVIYTPRKKNARFPISASPALTRLKNRIKNAAGSEIFREVWPSGKQKC